MGLARRVNLPLQDLLRWAYHVLNRATFGAAFALLMPRREIVTGIIWGLFREAFQLAFFPGWLGKTAYREFAQVSALSHMAYGGGLASCAGAPCAAR